MSCAESGDAVASTWDDRFVASDEQPQSIPAICGLLVGPVLFLTTVGAVLAQPDEFSVVNHENSDLGAETANSPWIANQLGSNLPGLLLFVFAIGLWRSLGRHRSTRIGPYWSVL